MPPGIIGGSIFAIILIAILSVVLIRLAKKETINIKNLLENVSEDNKHLMQNQTFTKTDKANLFTSNGYVAKAEEKNGNIEAIILFYSQTFDDYFSQKIKINSSDPKAQNIKVGNFIPTVMKYDKDFNMYKYNSLG